MNREIKFRAWLKKQKQMKNNVSFHAKQLWTGYAWIPLNNNIELMQYTGLKDKNGVEIYEGDIVRFEVDDIITKPFYIDYDKNDCSFSLFRKGIVDRGLMLHHQKDIVVIGNIYENPELLEVK